MFAMEMKLRFLAILAALYLAGPAGCRPYRALPSQLDARLVAEGLASPVELVTPPDASGRLFIVDQVGEIWIVSHGIRLHPPFLDLRDRLVRLRSFYDERGLLGLAFHPDFAANGLFYVYYSAPLREGLSPEEWDHTTRISEFHVSNLNAKEADPASERVLMTIDKPGYNYEAGDLGFGPDGYLYISTGDSVHDPSVEAGQYAQDTGSLLGKILRIDVNGAGANRPYGIPPDNPFVHGGGRPEIYAYGFRNPYRFSFDAAGPSGENRLFVGDVGQALVEEIDQVTSGGNYGWPVREGTTCFNAREWSQPLAHCEHSGLIDPIYEYKHDGRSSAVIGGVVYRGRALPGLYGDYIFGDWGRGAQYLFAGYAADSAGETWKTAEINVRLPGAGPAQLLGIGTDLNQELYILVKDLGAGPVGNSGKVYAIVPP